MTLWSTQYDSLEGALSTRINALSPQLASLVMALAAYRMAWIHSLFEAAGGVESLSSLNPVLDQIFAEAVRNEPGSEPTRRTRNDVLAQFTRHTEEGLVPGLTMYFASMVDDAQTRLVVPAVHLERSSHIADWYLSPWSQLIGVEWFERYNPGYAPESTSRYYDEVVADARCQRAIEAIERDVATLAGAGDDLASAAEGLRALAMEEAEGFFEAFKHFANERASRESSLNLAHGAAERNPEGQLPTITMLWSARYQALESALSARINSLPPQLASLVMALAAYRMAWAHRLFAAAGGAELISSVLPVLDQIFAEAIRNEPASESIRNARHGVLEEFARHTDDSFVRSLTRYFTSMVHNAQIRLAVGAADVEYTGYLADEYLAPWLQLIGVEPRDGRDSGDVSLDFTKQFYDQGVADPRCQRALEAIERDALVLKQAGSDLASSAESLRALAKTESEAFFEAFKRHATGRGRHSKG